MEEPFVRTPRKPFKLSERLKSFRCAFDGLRVIFQTQHNIWIHLSISLGVIVIGLLLRISFTDWAILSIAIGFVLAAEAFNTAIEFLVDLVSPGKLLQAGIIKDIAAAGVLIAAISAVAVGLLIFIPKIIE